MEGDDGWSGGKRVVDAVRGRGLGFMIINHLTPTLYSVKIHEKIPPISRRHTVLSTLWTLEVVSPREC